MKKTLKNVLLSLLMIVLVVPGTAIKAEDNIHEIVLNSVENADGSYTSTATIDGESITEYDYVWHADPTTEHDDVKNSPAEYYTGTEPDEDATIYVAHDIYYYPELDSSKYIKAQYGDDTEWLYYYEAEGYEEYIFATLPVEGSEVPTRMMHSEEEAYSNAVLHINEAGTYRLTGTWHGQIYIDLGEDSFDDPSAVVTLILDNADIECTVASGICFYQVYEVDNTWEDREEAISTIDTTGAGANIIIADDSTNTVSGANIYRILKTKYKDEDSTDAIKEQKKSKKVDGALYSYMSMNIDGEEKGNGVLNINSEFEGLDTELHLTINGGNINITSDNDGVNVNEDYVSIFTVNGGTLQILAGTGYEGDGIDSNGYLNINGGTVISSAKPQSDSGLDSDGGTYINGGTVIAMGSSMDVVTEYSEDANQVTMNLVFNMQQNITDSIAVKDSEDNVVFAYDLSKNDFFKDSGRTYQCLILSDDAFAVGNEYTIYEGGTVKGDETNGIYTTAKKVTDAEQLVYTSTGNFSMKGGMGFGDMNQDQMNQGGDVPEMPTEGFNEGETPEMPTEGFTEGEMPEGMGEVPELPEGMTEGEMQEGMGNGEQPQMGQGMNGGQMGQGMGQGGEAPEKPDGENGQGEVPEMPTGENTEEKTDMGDFDPTQNGGMNMETGSGEASTVFTAEDKVNTYSGVYATAVATETTSNALPTWAIVAISVGATALVAVAIVLIVNKSRKNKKEDITE